MLVSLSEMSGQLGRPPHLNLAECGADISPMGSKGLAFKKVLQAGNGDQPLEHNEVYMHYTGYVFTSDGLKQFDSSRDFKNPLKFKLHGGNCIWGRGWKGGGG